MASKGHSLPSFLWPDATVDGVQWPLLLPPLWPGVGLAAGGKGLWITKYRNSFFFALFAVSLDHDNSLYLFAHGFSTHFTMFCGTFLVHKCLLYFMFFFSIECMWVEIIWPLVSSIYTFLLAVYHHMILVTLLQKAMVFFFLPVDAGTEGVGIFPQLSWGILVEKLRCFFLLLLLFFFWQLVTILRNFFPCNLRPFSAIVLSPNYFCSLADCNYPAPAG